MLWQRFKSAVTQRCWNEFLFFLIFCVCLSFFYLKTPFDVLVNALRTKNASNESERSATTNTKLARQSTLIHSFMVWLRVVSSDDGIFELIKKNEQPA